VIIFLSLIEVYTGLETHWLHTWLLVACVIYVLSRARAKRRMALRANDFSQSRPGVRKDRNHPGTEDEWNVVVEQCPREVRAASREYSSKAARSAPPGPKRSRGGRVIDV
jgi:hypothetical protein